MKSTGQRSKSAGSRLLNYITRPQAVMKDKNGNVIFVKHNIQGHTLEDFLKAFHENEKNRQYSHSKCNYFYHDFIAFNPNDTKHLTPEILEDLTQKYLELRAATGMGVAVFHKDKHRHAHILLSAVELETGRALRLSKADFDKVKQELQAYQMEKYPELAESVIDFDKPTRQSITDKEVQMKARTGKLTRKEELKNILNLSFEKSITLEDFYSYIRERGLSIYERRDMKGITDEGKRYRFDTLGYGEDKIKELTTRSERMSDLQFIREEKNKLGLENAEYGEEMWEELSSRTERLELQNDITEETSINIESPKSPQGEIESGEEIPL